MESDKIYETSRTEILRLQKQISGGSLSIDFSKLDAETKSVLSTQIKNVLSKRLREVESVIMGAN